VKARKQEWILAIVTLVLSVGIQAAETAPQPMALLAAGHYAQLDEAMQAVQRDYKRGAITDEQLLAAFRPFYALGGPEQDAQFDAWVKLRPRSYAAYLARAIHYKYVGLKVRGENFIADTPREQLTLMATAFERAAADLKRSMELDDKPLLSYLHAMDISKHFSERLETRTLLDLAIEIDPQNMIVRRKYLTTLPSRWGGSYELMKTFVEECRRAKLSAVQMRELESMLVDEEVWVLFHKKKDYARVATLTERSLKEDPANLTMLRFRVPALTRLERYEETIAAAAAILELKPHDPDALSQRGFAYLQINKVPEAAADYREAATLGDVYAQKELAVLYWQGRHVPKDRALALEWLKKAAANGDKDAQRELQRVTAK
jgi:tetratricopeptide (TPR) repeat protein